MALPLSITVIFVRYPHVRRRHPGLGPRQEPERAFALTYAWIGPFVGALIRPVGGWISDKVGGSIVTQIISVVMVAASAYGRLDHDAGVPVGHAGNLLHPVHRHLRGAVRRHRHRQRLPPSAPSA